LNRIAAWLLCAILLCVYGSAFGEEFYARVVVVLDGDTVMIRRSEGLEKIRLAEIDAPEKHQAYGMASRQFLIQMVFHKQVWINTLTVDKYGRKVAQLKLDGLSVNEEMVRRGMAWEYSNYHSDRRYIALQQEARQARRGLWAQHNPQPPWQWRKQQMLTNGTKLD
jgi:endonuclease YncB( thermonuclease family)